MSVMTDVAVSTQGLRGLAASAFLVAVYALAPLDTVHVAGNFPNILGGLPLRSDVLGINADRLDRTHLLTALQLADGTVLGIGGLATGARYRVRLELGDAVALGRAHRLHDAAELDLCLQQVELRAR